MEPTMTKIFAVIILLPLIIVSGIFLRKKSRPYNNILFTLHKLLALAVIIFSIIVIRGALKNADISGYLFYLLILTAALLLFSLVTGALQSFEKEPPKIINTIHRVSSYTMFLIIPLSFILILFLNN